MVLLLLYCGLIVFRRIADKGTLVLLYSEVFMQMTEWLLINIVMVSLFKLNLAPERRHFL